MAVIKYKDSNGEYKKIKGFSKIAPDVVDNLASTSVVDPLSANQGKVLNEAIQEERQQRMEDVAGLTKEMEKKQNKLTAGTGISISNNTISCTLDPTIFVVVDSLPASPAASNINKIHLVKDTTVEGNLYSEYLWVNNAWGKLGDFQSTIDLSNYIDKTSDQTITAPKTFSGGINMNNTRIQKVQNPSENTDAVNKVYVDERYNTLETKNTELANTVASLETRIVGSENILAYGVEVDFSNGKSSPQCNRIGNPLYHKTLPVQSEFRGCIVKDGVFQYWLDPSNWNLKEDGTPSKLDGTDGSMMGYVPKHYFKFENLLKNEEGHVIKFRVWESTVKIDDDYVEVPAMYISSDRVTIDKSADKTVCVINTSTNYRGGGDRAAQDTYLDTDAYRSDLGKPRTALSRSTVRTKARNANEYILNYEFYKFVLYWNFVVEYATLNSQLGYNDSLTSDLYHQGGLGSGFTNLNNWDKYNSYNPCVPIGYTNEFGNFSGVKSITIPAFEGTDGVSYNEQTLSVCRYRCFNQPFGDIWTILDGYIGIGDGNNGQDVYTTKNPELYNDSSIEGYDYKGKQTAPNGYYKYTIVGKEGEIIPTESGGNSITYFCDYNYIGSTNGIKCALWVGGIANYGAYAGLGYFFSAYGVGYSNAVAGFRTFCFAE